MAVIDCRLTRTNRPSTFGLKNQNQHEVEFLITTDTKFAFGPTVFVEATQAAPDPLPQHYDNYDFGGDVDLNAYCTQISLTPDPQDAQRWKAVASFSQLPPGDTQEQSNIINPLFRPPIYGLDFMIESRPIEKDISGEPIDNTVGDEYQEPMMEDISYPVLVVRKNYATLQEIVDLARDYHRSTNSDTFYGSGPKTAKLLPFTSPELMIENGIKYYAATLRVAFNPDTWTREILNQGFRYRKVAGGPIVEFIDAETKMKTVTPVRLKEDGTLAGVGEKFYTKHEVLKPKAYANLGI